VTSREATLWSRWAERRDPRAFEDLVRTLQRFAYDFAHRVAGNDADAEDLAQEAFLELAEAPADRPGAVGLRAFLGRRIVLSGRMLRRAALTRTRHERAAARPERLTPPESRADAAAALALLDRDDRHAIELRFLHGLSYREVAHVLGVSEPAARMRTHRALNSLRERLGPRAHASIAGLALFACPSSFCGNTVKTAALAGGMIVMGSTGKKLLAVVLLLAVLGTGAALSLSGRDRPDGRTSQRAKTTSAPPAPPAKAPGQQDDAPDPPADPAPRPAETRGGRVLAPDGTPLRHAKLELTSGVPVHTETDAEGRFSIPRGWSGERGLFITLPGGGQFALAVLAPESDLEIRMIAGHVLEGGVVHAGTRNPVAGAHVRFRRPGATGAGIVQGRWVHARTDDDGRFRVEHLPAGSYDLWIEAPGLEAVVRQVDVRADLAPFDIKLKPARDLTIVFQDLPMEWRGSELQIVIGTTGSAAFRHRARIDERGVIRVDAPPPGRYRLTAFSHGWMPTLEADLDVEPNEAARVEFRMPPGARVGGTITPAVGAEVILRPHELTCHSGTGGRFLFPFVPAGECRLQVRVGRATLHAVTLDVPTTGELIHDLRLRGATVRGRLVIPGSSANWVRTVELRSARDAQTVVAVAEPDVAGRFAIPFVVPGDYELEGRAGPGERTHRIIRVGAEDLDLGDLVASATMRLPVVVSAQPGTRLAGTHFFYGQRGTESFAGFLHLDERGRGHATGLKPGPWELHIQLGAGHVVAAEISSDPKQTLRIDLR
jgi:RNA polymerase sigma-70 factor (ECF subfamily)